VEEVLAGKRKFMVEVEGVFASGFEDFWGYNFYEDSVMHDLFFSTHFHEPKTMIG